MFLNPYHSQQQDRVLVTPDQASHFAKEVANDFNPIHDPDNKRFCVPGDLLFSLVLDTYGLSEQMDFKFAGMVGKGAELVFPKDVGETVQIHDLRGKLMLQVQRTGAVSHDRELIEHFARNYVAFSGQNFPGILVPLLSEQGVMLNPERPLVIYESMSFQLTRLDIHQRTLSLAKATLDVKGKRGNARLYFQVESAGEVVGEGYKQLVVSGLRDHVAAEVQAMVDGYLASKAEFPR